MGVIHQEVFPMTWDEIQAQYKRWKTDPKKVKECEKILEEWYQKQAHLPQKLPFDNFFEKAFVMCCFRMELCKRKIETYFSYKRHYTDFYDVFDPSVPVLLPSESPVTLVPMPKLGPNLDRIWVGFLERKNHNNLNLIAESLLQLMTACRELAFRYEKSNSLTVVADCREYGNNFYFQRNFLQLILRFAVFTYYATNIKIQGVHLVNLGPLWHVFINVLRTFIPQKLMKRINTLLFESGVFTVQQAFATYLVKNELHIHNSYDSLYKAVSKEYLPEEFGGTQVSTSQILEKWDTLFLENQKYLLECGKYVSDESRRIGECPYNAMFGVEGSFRKLEID